jgi:hypothetical protein
MQEQLQDKMLRNKSTDEVCCSNSARETSLYEQIESEIKRLEHGASEAIGRKIGLQALLDNLPRAIDPVQQQAIKRVIKTL